MKGTEHLLIGIIFSLAVILGSLLPDLDHNCGSIITKVKAFFGTAECGERNILHKPLVMLGMIVGFFGLSIGLFLHIVMDFIFG